jgi:Neuraminidase (sialidase)
VSNPQVIVGQPSLDQTIGDQIVVDRQSGALYGFFNLIRNRSNAGGHRAYNVAFVKSTDGGATWSAPNVIAALQTAGVSDPNNLDPETNAPPAPSRTGDIIPEPAINPNNGQLYVIWQDSRFNGFASDEVVISTSSNGGGTWSPPELVNAHTGQPPYDPSVYINTGGVVAVSSFQRTGTVSGNAHQHADPALHISGQQLDRPGLRCSEHAGQPVQQPGSAQRWGLRPR